MQIHTCVFICWWSESGGGAVHVMSTTQPVHSDCVYLLCWYRATVKLAVLHYWEEEYCPVITCQGFFPPSSSLCCSNWQSYLRTASRTLLLWDGQWCCYRWFWYIPSIECFFYFIVVQLPGPVMADLHIQGCSLEFIHAVCFQTFMAGMCGPPGFVSTRVCVLTIRPHWIFTYFNGR